MTTPRYTELVKGELLAMIAAQWAEWNALIERAGGRLTTPGVEGAWSVKDVIAHICQGERWMVGQLGAPVRPLPPPPPGVDVADQDQFNAWLYELERERPLADVLAEADQVHAQLVELVRARPEDELHAHFAVNPRVPPEALSASEAAWQPGWPLWRWVVSETFDHYQQHMPPLRAWLDKLPAV